MNPIGDPPIKELRQGAQKAVDQLDQMHGPEKNIPLFVLVARFCHIYEAVTAKRVTHSSKAEHRAYTQDACSDAGKFVSGIIHENFKKVQKTRINLCMKEFVKNRPELF